MSDGPPFGILFVCTGNTCRSPLAEAVALLDPALETFQPDMLPTGWHDWLIADVLRQEAERLIAGGTNESVGSPSEHP